MEKYPWNIDLKQTFWQPNQDGFVDLSLSLDFIKEIVEKQHFRKYIIPILYFGLILD